jgi:uncharacterized protein with PIN domain
MIVVDTSAIIAILDKEPDAQPWSAAQLQYSWLLMGALPMQRARRRAGTSALSLNSC